MPLTIAPVASVTKLIAVIDLPSTPFMPFVPLVPGSPFSPLSDANCAVVKSAYVKGSPFVFCVPRVFFRSKLSISVLDLNEKEIVYANNIYYASMLGLEMYDKIIATSKSEETKANAEANKKIALEAAYAN